MTADTLSSEARITLMHDMCDAVNVADAIASGSDESYKTTWEMSYIVACALIGVSCDYLEDVFPASQENKNG